MKLYILVRKDLSLSQICVQAGHAVAEWMIYNYDGNSSENVWTNGTLVYLGVENEAMLLDWYKKLAALVKFDNLPVHFAEPYYNHEMTAFGILGTPEVVEAVKDLKLV